MYDKPETRFYCGTQKEKFCVGLSFPFNHNELSQKLIL